MPGKVLISGAGPTGLVAAISLAKLNIPFRIIDKNKGPGRASRAIAVHARTLEFYQQLEVSGEIIQKGIVLDRLQIFKEGKLKAMLKLEELGKGLSPFPFVLTLPQDEHEQILVGKLNELGHRVDWETELVSFRQQDGFVAVVLSKNGRQEEERYSYLCGCDGVRSTVRKGLGLDFAGGTYQQVFYVADVQSGSSVKGVQVRFFKEGFAIALPVRATGSLRLIGLLPPFLSDKQNVGFSELATYIETKTKLRVDKENWFSTYKVHHRVSERFQKGNVFLAGDAAHVHSPAGGQGMNTGIGDAFNLSWKLADVLKGKSNPAILGSYESERKAFAESLVSTTDRMFEILVGEGLSSKMVKGVILPYVAPTLTKSDRVKHMMFKTLSQIRIHYRDSALSEGAAGSIHGGDRLPWVPAEEGDNFLPLQAMDWQFHVYGEATPELIDLAKAHAIPYHQFPWTKIAEKAGIAQNAVFLVRPDGHVAVADDGNGLDTMENYLIRLKSR
ncbi:FAD-dependent monooxygenase [Planococcus salinus]|uniref:Monooxygenase n=1 Tax=Planococcus salinus TaxID=1848460 RepID=A0A3M8PBP4_9BACL|nr:FAD-dependent monooxygenase [Planococcus salinus]RNF41138.1 monooxygenase [Planococcus salinus]